MQKNSHGSDMAALIDDIKSSIPENPPQRFILILSQKLLLMFTLLCNFDNLINNYKWKLAIL